MKLKKDYVVGLLSGLLLASTVPTLANVGEYVSAIRTKQTIFLDEQAVDWTVYNVNDENYIRLADLCPELGVGLAWDPVANAVRMTSDGSAPTLSESVVPSTVDYEAVYGEVLDNIVKTMSMEDFYDFEDYGLPYAMRLYKRNANNLGYAYLDVNGDGVPELFVGVVGETGSLMAFSIIGGEAVCIAEVEERYGVILTSQGTFYEWGSSSAFESYVRESQLTTGDYGPNMSNLLEPITNYWFLAYDFMSEAQCGWYTGSQEAYERAVYGEDLSGLLKVTETVVYRFEGFIEAYEFSYTPLSSSNTQETSAALVIGRTYGESALSNNIIFYENGTYCLETNLYVGFGNDYGQYMIEGDQIVCTVTDRDWMGFPGDDVYQYSFFVKADSSLEFRCVNGVGESTSTVGTISGLYDGDILVLW